MSNETENISTKKATTTVEIIQGVFTLIALLLVLLMFSYLTYVAMIHLWGDLLTNFWGDLFDAIYSRDYLEKLYFIFGGPVLVIVAIFGLRQIKIGMAQINVGLNQIKSTEDIARIQNERDALRLTAEQNDILSNKIMLLSPNLQVCAFSLRTLQSITVDGDVITIKPIDSNADTKIKQLVAANGNEIIALANACDAFAFYFTSKLAYEELVFDSNGESFCWLYEFLNPVISEKITSYPHASKLYKQWKLRIEKRKLQDVVNESQTKISGMKTPPLSKPLTSAK